ncbi:UNKNOWN [Stylonychia lemnae]|uniref:Uncharacterized protein n=1 Tax=Stylonychia lemnae TaxID=5949 RepID=A0A078A8U7_STYLE|nr:UNKNOWN [Stylonychia lemnae]|eukprot:CDW77223.1 UNKNOWN [Stylonychia lemnae]
MESTSAPTQIETTIDTTTAPPSINDISTNRYLSVEISKLMPLITDDLSDPETSIYLNAAVLLAKESKDMMRTENFAQGINKAAKASAKIEKLCDAKLEKNPEFQILKAPFYYLLANNIITYVERASDVFGNVAQLPEPEDSEAESEIEEDEEDENEPDASNNAEEEQKQGDKEEEKSIPKVDENEPKIEEEKQQLNQLEQDEPHKDPEDYAGQLCDDAYEHLEIAIQLMENFMDSQGCLEAYRPLRKQVIINLMIDVHNREAELFSFKEQYKESIQYFDKVVDLCSSDESSNVDNLRLMASALYNIGFCNQQMKMNEPASKAYKQAVEVMKTSIIIEMGRNGQKVDEAKKTAELLVQPSIFDNDSLKELKALLQEILIKVQETNDQEKIDEQIQQIKKDEGEEVKVDENFGKPMANSDQFKDMTACIKIGKKRTHNEISNQLTTSAEDKLSQNESKKMKLNNDSQGNSENQNATTA